MIPCMVRVWSTARLVRAHYYQVMPCSHCIIDTHSMAAILRSFNTIDRVYRKATDSIQLDHYSFWSLSKEIHSCQRRSSNDSKFDRNMMYATHDNEMRRHQRSQTQGNSSTPVPVNITANGQSRPPWTALSFPADPVPDPGLRPTEEASHRPLSSGSRRP